MLAFALLLTFAFALKCVFEFTFAFALKCVFGFPFALVLR
jgi:hypothetical protein